MSKSKPVKPSTDPQLFEVTKELRELAETLPSVCADVSLNLQDMANRLELTAQAGFEDSYSYCADLIDPHIKEDTNGMYSISQESLIPSVNESLQYLIEFWIANKDKPGIDLCL